MVTTLETLLVVHDDLEDRGWAPLKISRAQLKTCMLGEKAKWDVKHYKSSSYSTPADTFEEIYYPIIAKASR